MILLDSPEPAIKNSGSISPCLYRQKLASIKILEARNFVARILALVKRININAGCTGLREKTTENPENP